MRTILVKYYSPNDAMDLTPETTDEEIKQACFRVAKYNTEFDCLQAYANTPVTWSTILDDAADYKVFVDEAFERIKNHDIDWLEQNFV